MTKSLGRILLGLLLLGLFGVALTPVHDFDLFWQMQSGKYHWQTGELIRTDTFSLAADVPRFEHCWLHDLIFYGTWSLGGYVAVSFLKALIVVSLGGALVGAARSRAASWPTILAVTIPLTLCTFFSWLERPQLWTFLGFSLALWCYERNRSRPGKGLWWLVPLVAVWSNLHAGVLLILPLLLAWMAGDWVDSRYGRPSRLDPPLLRRLWWVLPATALAIALTPYAPQMAATLFSDPLYGNNPTTLTSAGNMDWRPMTFAANPWFYYLAGFSALLLAICWRKVQLRDVLLLAGLFFMGNRLERHTVFLFLGAAALLPRYLDDLGSMVRPFHGRKTVVKVLVLIVSCLPALWVINELRTERSWFNPGLTRWHFPVAAADFVRQERLPGNLYNTYDWGGYLMFVLYPEYKVFWDGRQTSSAMFREGYVVARGDQDWQSVLDRHQINTLVLKPCTMDTGQRYPLLDRLRTSTDWAPVFADESSLVFVRTSAVPAPWLEEKRLTTDAIDAAILSEAGLLVKEDRFRYMAWWEIARIYLARKDYRQAFTPLENHLASAPPEMRVKEAQTWYNLLTPMMKQ